MPRPATSLPGLVAGLALALTLAGCGGGDGATAVVDPEGEPPLVNSFDLDPADGAFLLTTNRGFFRIPPDGGAARLVRGTVSEGRRRAPLGAFLDLEPVGPGKLIGSGHPDGDGPLPQYLGFIRSDDGGRTWRVVSRLGDADLHQIRRAHGRLYAFDAVLGAILVSSDEGRTWTERFTPRQLILDFVVDPEEPDRIVASTDDQLFRTEDGGESWRPIGQARAARLDWPRDGPIMRADRDGTFLLSANAGRTWRPTGRLSGEPYEVRATSARRAFVALGDGAIVETKDAGRSFADRFVP